MKTNMDCKKIVPRWQSILATPERAHEWEFFSTSFIDFSWVFSSLIWKSYKQLEKDFDNI